MSSPLSPTLVVEDGTVVLGANTYLGIGSVGSPEVSGADTYFENLMDTVWLNALPAQKGAALIKAGIFLRQQFRLKWAGSLMDANQAMDWPRRGVPVPDFFDPFYERVLPVGFENTYYIPENSIPQLVKDAQCMLARYTMDDSGISNVPLQSPLGRKTASEQVGPIAVSYFPDGQGGGRQTTFYWDVENLLAPLLDPAKNSGISGRVTRA